MINHFETTRLTAERMGSDHFAELCRMHGDPQVMATLGGIRGEDETRQYLAQNLAHWQDHGYGLWVFRSRQDCRFVGRGGLRNVFVGGAKEVEVAYALMAEFWGKGYATEMARASLAVAFDRLGLSNVVAFTLVTNRASRRVMEKAGFQFEREIVHANLPHVLYRIQRPGIPPSAT